MKHRYTIRKARRDEGFGVWDVYQSGSWMSTWRSEEEAQAEVRRCVAYDSKLGVHDAAR